MATVLDRSGVGRLDKALTRVADSRGLSASAVQDMISQSVNPVKADVVQATTSAKPPRYEVNLSVPAGVSIGPYKNTWAIPGIKAGDLIIAQNQAELPDDVVVIHFRAPQDDQVEIKVRLSAIRISTISVPFTLIGLRRII